MSVKKQNSTLMPNPSKKVESYWKKLECREQYYKLKTYKISSH
jgi:hypothetical protein